MGERKRNFLKTLTRRAHMLFHALKRLGPRQGFSFDFKHFIYFCHRFNVDGEHFMRFQIYPDQCGRGLSFYMITNDPSIRESLGCSFQQSSVLSRDVHVTDLRQ